MNYNKHYTLLINKAQSRTLEGYTEKHHIIPKCMGGGNNPENVVRLTPEEHYLAHQLLTRIYPNNHSLKKAAWMMCVKSDNQQRNNKIYGWVKRNARPVGETNGMFGKTHTDEVCLKLGKLASQRFRGKSYNELYGKEKADSMKREISNKLKEYRKNNPVNGVKNPNAKTYLFIDPNGKKSIVAGNLKVFCKENSLYLAKIIDVAKNRLPDYKGWKVTYL